jgi:hypothetical protein
MLLVEQIHDNIYEMEGVFVFLEGSNKRPSFVYDILLMVDYET